jgi:hypothetical protein
MSRTATGGWWKPAAEVAAVLPLLLLSQLREEIRFTNQLSYDVVPASNTARFLIISAVIVLAATTVIIVTKGQLGRVKEAAGTQAGASDLHTSRKLRFRSAADGVDGISRAR